MFFLQSVQMKAGIIILSVLTLLGTASLPVKAEEKHLTKSATFTSESQKPNYDGFAKEIEENGVSYQLSDISYKKIDESQKTENQDKTTSVHKTGLRSKSYQVGASEPITVDNKDFTGTITKVDYTDMTIRGRTGEVSGSQDYGLRIDKPEPPQTKVLQYYDGDTGQTLNIEAPLTNLEQTSSQWQDYTHIDIVVSNYTDTQFMFNGKIINHNGTTVLSSSYYSELLSMAGLSDSNCKISSVTWISDSYKEGNVRYRNARANIQAYSCSYTAHYHKSFSLPDVPVFDADITYAYSTEKVLKTVYTYTATAVYLPQKQESSSAEETTQEPTRAIRQSSVPITVKAVTTLSLILVLSLAFVLLALFLLTKIKSKDTKLSKVLSKKRRK